MILNLLPSEVPFIRGVLPVYQLRHPGSFVHSSVAISVLGNQFGCILLSVLSFLDTPTRLGCFVIDNVQALWGFRATSLVSFARSSIWVLVPDPMVAGGALVDWSPFL